MAEDDARARMAAQASREDRLEAADFVVDNSGELPDLEERGRRPLAGAGGGRRLTVRLSRCRCGVVPWRHETGR